MQRLWLTGVLVVAAVLPSRGARAEAERAVVAVLPLDAADERMAIYSKPVADAVARALSSATSIRVESLPLAGALPARVSLVIDGRIVSAGKRKVKLEARIRDPGRGVTTVSSVATRARPLADIDALAGELAAMLGPRLTEAVAAQKRQTKAEKRAPPVARAAVPPKKPTAGNGGAGAARPREPAPRDPRPPLLVIRAGGKEVDRAVPLSDIATRAGYWLVARLGHRPVQGQGEGITTVAEITRQLEATGTRFGLMLDMRGIEYKWHGRVLSARGRVRVVVVDNRGHALFDRTARTGTLVGSRGDGRAALAHYVAIQAIDIVAPLVRRSIPK